MNSAESALRERVEKEKGSSLFSHTLVYVTKTEVDALADQMSNLTLSINKTQGIALHGRFV